MNIIKRYIRTRYTLAIFIMVVLWMWLAHALTRYGDAIPEWMPIGHAELLVLINALFSTIVAALVVKLTAFNIVRSELSEFMLASVLLRKEYLENLSIESKRILLTRLLNDALGNTDLANLFYRLIMPYGSRANVNLRRSIRYEIRIRRMDEGSFYYHHNDTRRTLSPDEYNIIDNHDVFRIPRRRWKKTQRYLEIVFSFTPEQLDEAFRLQECVFRDLIALSMQDRDRLLAIFEQERSEPVASTVLSGLIRYRCFINRSETSTVNVTYDKNVGLRIAVRPEKSLGRGEETEIEVISSTPFLKEARVYPIIYGEPTVANIISFTAPGCEITWYPMFTVGDPQRITFLHTNEDQVTLNLGGQWVFPNSGVLFAWRSR